MTERSAKPLERAFELRQLRYCCLLLLISINVVGAAATQSDGDEQSAQFSEWIAKMKLAKRGPFARIRWFCADGQILPPTPYACAEFGGGRQHGQWSKHSLALREAGFAIANFYADIDVDQFVATEARTDWFAQMLIEQFLVAVDDGWILRQARYYRGAYQSEQEQHSARNLLFALVQEDAWLDSRFLNLRAAARYLAHGSDNASVQEIRQLSASLSDRDVGFKPVRNKIHGQPELGDAGIVRAYAEKSAGPALLSDLERLADLIERARSVDIDGALKSLGAASHKSLADAISGGRAALNGQSKPRRRVQILAQLLFDLRDQILVSKGSRRRLQILDTSLVVENEFFTTAAAESAQLTGLTRREKLSILHDHLQALYGVGLISKRQFTAANESIDTLFASSDVKVQRYKEVADYLGLVPNWGAQNLRRFFGRAMDKLTQIEPKSAHFIQDYLRGSPMFSYAMVVDKLVRDANQLAGVSNELFGENHGAGLRSLNPGLARGELHFALGKNLSDLDSKNIYVLPETVSELPPVAGILTAGEGNPLSHVQLLARNLGIPNVGVDQTLLKALREYAGRNVVMAVSPAGSVRLNLDDGKYAAHFADEGHQANSERLIEVDLKKLDLVKLSFLTLSELRATDSGRVVGPKAAKLGELKHHYPSAVAEGLAIPFGIFKGILDQQIPATSQTIFEWMRSEYARIGDYPNDSAVRRSETQIFRAKLQDLIANADPGEEFRKRLRKKLIDTFGPDGSFGVFVRSDTNVEDLPGFTGAGLNLTVANVVGIDNIINAVSQVWASPFSERSFAWRQTLMDKPEHVYPAVLLMRSVDADKSGVLVTQDIDSGDNEWLSVSTNEGVGGAVDGQSAESVRINTRSGEVKLMAASTAPIRRQVDLTGGVKKLPVSSRDRVLDDGDIEQLIALAKQLPSRFPAIVDAAGNAAPADIEFGFLDGELRLFQIRPFLDSDKAQNNELLRELDGRLAERADHPVELGQSGE